MKQLQNNFTTPEQSERLLELGVPADSADCYIRTDSCNFNPSSLPIDSLFKKNDVTYTQFEKSLQRCDISCIPCWSVGRLMEIYGICMGVEGFFYCKGNFIDEAIRRIEGSAKNNLIDFSKLEE